MTPESLTAVLDATWPALRFHAEGPWLVREGGAGGNRVTCITARTGWSDADLPLAEAAAARIGQRTIFMIRDGEETLDAALAARGYRFADPVRIWSVPVDRLAGEIPFLGAFEVWPPLAAMTTIWEGDGIGPARIAIMERAPGPKTAILGRVSDRPAGVAFVALAGADAMLHALTVALPFRRRGCAATILRAAANWATAQGATMLHLAVTRENAPANALYASAGMEVSAQYHYRAGPEPVESQRDRST